MSIAKSRILIRATFGYGRDDRSVGISESLAIALRATSTCG